MFLEQILWIYLFIYFSHLYVIISLSSVFIRLLYYQLMCSDITPSFTLYHDAINICSVLYYLVFFISTMHYWESYLKLYDVSWAFFTNAFSMLNTRFRWIWEVVVSHWSTTVRKFYKSLSRRCLVPGRHAPLVMLTGIVLCKVVYYFLI